MFQRSIKALFKITGPFGSKIFSSRFLESLFAPAGSAQASLSFWRCWAFDHKSFSRNDWGCTPTPMGRTGYRSQVSIGLERNSFKAIYLAPTKFSASSQSTNDSEASQPHQCGSAQPLWERSGADYKGPHRYKRERNYRTVQTLMRTKGPLFCHIQMRAFQDHRWQQGANKQWLLFCILFLTFFLIEPCIGQFKN